MIEIFDSLDEIVLDRPKVLVRHFTAYGVKWLRELISNVRKETERPRSSRSLTSWRYT